MRRLWPDSVAGLDSPCDASLVALLVREGIFWVFLRPWLSACRSTTRFLSSSLVFARSGIIGPGVTGRKRVF